MTDLAALETGLQTWAETLSGLPLEWGRQPMQNHDSPFILAYPGAIVPRGWDEKTYSYNSVLDQQDLQMSGIRYFTVTLSFRSYDQRLSLSSRRYAEDFLVLVQSPGSIQTLTDLNVAFSGMQGITDTDYTYNRRRISQVDMDMALGLRYFRDDPFTDGAYIKTVNILQGNYIQDESGAFVYDNAGEILGDEPTDFVTVTE